MLRSNLSFPSVFLILFLLIFIPVVQAASFTGRVVNKENNHALSGAHIILHDLNTGQISDQNGNFEFKNIDSGKYLISVSYVGFNVIKRVIDISSNTDLDFKLVPRVIEENDVVFTSSRAKAAETPSSFSNYSKKQIDDQYWAQDIPLLLETIPGVHSYSDNGMGIGYSYVKIRGFDQKRLGVTINNVPLNDPEEGVVYWVDMPDLAANVEDMQVQRGVGYSSFGTGGFGGTINVLTATPSGSKPSYEANFGGGSFNTRKWGLALNSGLVDNTYGVYGRFSHIQTDGYRDRSGVELWSYFLTGVRHGKNSVLKLNLYGGPELTHASWDASPQADLAVSRTHNPIEYKNTIDDFNQPHYELHHEWSLSPEIKLENTLFWIRGEGYYEQFKGGKDLYEFGFQPFTENGVPVEESDFVNRKWVVKDQVGWMPRLTINKDYYTFKTGADFQWYQSDHYGFVIWGNNIPVDAEPRKKYYSHEGKILQGGAFAQAIVYPSDGLNFIFDLEFRFRQYEMIQQQVANFVGDEVNRFQTTDAFINPKFGANLNITDEISVFTNIGISHRAPTANEYWDTWTGPDDIGVDPLFSKADTTFNADGTVKFVEWSDATIDPESMIDIELGTSFKNNYWNLKANTYLMSLQNEIVAAGGIDDGAPVQDNAERTTHTGIEVELSYLPKVGAFGWINLSYSIDELSDYTIYEYDWDTGETSTLDLSGNSIALFPEYMINAAAGMKAHGFSGMLQMQSVGKQYLDNFEMDDRVIDAYTLFNMSVAVNLPEFMPGVNWELQGRVNNILDVEYESSGYYDAWGGGNCYYVGASRNYFFSLIAKL